MAPENSGENSGDQLRHDLAHHGAAFVLDGHRVDPDAVRVLPRYWRVRVSPSMGEAHLATLAGKRTLCGYHRRPYGGWPQMFGLFRADDVRDDVTLCLTCRGQVTA